MSNSKLTIIVLFGILLTGATAFILNRPVPAMDSEAPESIVIPFTLTESNNISVQVTINETNRLNLMFHTGNSNVCLTEEATAKIANIDFDQTAEAKSWGGDASSRQSSENQLEIGELKWQDVTIFEDLHSGPGTDGKFGPDLFKDKVFEINFEQNQLIVHSSLPVLDDEYKRLDCLLNRGGIFVKGTFGDGSSEYQNVLMIHSGFSGTILLEDEFVASSGLSDKLKVISESELKDSFGNVIKTKKAMLPWLTISDSKFADIPIGFFEGDIGRQKHNVMGCELLRRFNFVFDLKNSHVYLKPNRAFAEKFES